MPLLTYRQVRPWAKAIREVVLTRRMPPWFAAPEHGKFVNDTSLSKGEIDKLATWVSSGAPEGDPSDLPPEKVFTHGWNLGVPDVVFELPQYTVPASGVIEYTSFVIPTGFTEDKWVEQLELRPGDRSVVHHAGVTIREVGDSWLRQAPIGQPFTKTASEGKKARDTSDKAKEPSDAHFGPELLMVYLPGGTTEPPGPGRAKLIKAGSDLIFTIHYTPNGKPTIDRTRLGLTFAKEPPAERVVTFAAVNQKLAIPPGDPNYRLDTRAILREPAKLIGFFPHMHLRGKAFEYRVVSPRGESTTVLKVPRYDFNWQLYYKLEEPLLLEAGSRLEATAWYDNSPNNPFNPDPKVEVRWGAQTWDEMMGAGFDLAIKTHQDPTSLFTRKTKYIIEPEDDELQCLSGSQSCTDGGK
ncbi:MAG: thiol-disulfide isomerase [Acidobacteria bacterium]|nr:thiol-disulfide isomerase [Acidobacteriota bacterium]